MDRRIASGPLYFSFAAGLFPAESIPGLRTPSSVIRLGVTMLHKARQRIVLERSGA
ncbi:MAG: hypothetical protein V7640_3804 [Betaproteobacteria bacterium]